MAILEHVVLIIVFRKGVFISKVNTKTKQQQMSKTLFGSKGFYFNKLTHTFTQTRYLRMDLI